MATRLCSLVLLLAGLAGCKVDSINPISPPEAAHADPALYGLWRYREKDELVYVHIGPEHSLVKSADQGRPLRIVIVDHKPGGVTDEAYTAYASRAGKQRYLNIVQAEGNKEVGFLFVRYTLANPNTLRFSMIEDAALQAAIGAGRIAGTVRGEGAASQTTITAASGEIERFLVQEGGKLFGPPLVLKRVPDR
ncbi:MAG: hypothetical protein IT521_05125 [Burkholderiales bacterium]|nr:hypothetical protein [Burkholderiales bacterium]